MEQKFVPYTDTKTVQRYVGTLENGSQGGWRCETSKQKGMSDYAAVQCASARELIYSNAILCKEAGGSENSTDCLGHKYTCLIYVSTRCTNVHMW